MKRIGQRWEQKKKKSKEKVYYNNSKSEKWEKKVQIQKRNFTAEVAVATAA